MVNDALEHQLQRWLNDFHPGSTLHHTRNLDGGTATQMLAFEFSTTDGTTQMCILRQPNTHDLARDPQAAQHEYQLLHQLKQAGLPVPPAHAVDQECAYFNTPILILDYLPGEVVYEPMDRASFAHQAANFLAHLHQIDITTMDLSFVPAISELYGQRLFHPPTELDDELLEGTVRDALLANWPIVSPNPSRLLHGDYWLGNFLWEDGVLVAVIDWENAVIGDPLADLATARLEMLWMFDHDMMSMFTQAYLHENPIDTTALPWWELATVLRSAFHISDWADPANIKGLREKQRWFLTQALDKLIIAY